MQFKKIITKRGFTLLEILLVVGIIAVLAAIVIIAINPSKQLATFRNTERASNLKQIYNAMQQYYIDHGVYPGTMPSTLTEICNTGANPSTTTSITGTPCGTLVNLSDLVPVYLVAIPVDPLGSPVAFLTNIAQAATVGTGYLVGVNANNKITVQDMAGELGVVHTFGPESSQLCTAFTYSDWSTCSNSTRTRTITTSSPSGCTGGTSSTTESCIMSYNVIFNANGGTGSMSNQTMASGTSQTLTMNTFARTGYTFTGWALSSGGAVVYDDGESFTMQGGDVELWAQWASNEVTISTYSSTRYWSNATYAVTCDAYRNPAVGYSYSGSTGDGVYRIDPDGAGGNVAFDVYCDMTTNGGGWTLVMRGDYTDTSSFVPWNTTNSLNLSNSTLLNTGTFKFSDAIINTVRTESNTYWYACTGTGYTTNRYFNTTSTYIHTPGTLAVSNRTSWSDPAKTTDESTGEDSGSRGGLDSADPFCDQEGCPNSDYGFRGWGIINNGGTVDPWYCGDGPGPLHIQHPAAFPVNLWLWVK